MHIALKKMKEGFCMENICINCGMSLKGGVYTAPWEDDDNPDGYIKCPHCGSINFQDDDDD